VSACSDPKINERLVELLDGDSAEVRAHVETCESCAQELVQMREAFGALERDRVEPPSEAVLARAHSGATPSRVPVGVMLGGLVAAGVLTAVIRVQPGLLSQWGALVAVALSAAAWMLGARAAENGRSGDPAFWSVAALGALTAIASQPSGGLGSMTCLALSLAAASGPFVVAAIGLRAGFSGVVTGAASGLLGLAVIRMHCPAGGLPHALMHHLPVVLPFLALGLLAARMRRRPANTARA
jgi:hypothetical protein